MHLRSRILAEAPLDAGIILLIIVLIILVLVGIGCFYGVYLWHGKHELETIIYFHAEHKRLRGRDQYWLQFKGDHKHAYIHNHSYMLEHYPNALKVYHCILRSGPLEDIVISEDERETFYEEMIKANANHGNHSHSMEHETIPKCYWQINISNRNNNDPALIFQRRAVKFMKLYKGEIFSQLKEFQESWEHPKITDNFDVQLLVADESSLSYQLGLENDRSPAWWVSTVKSRGYNNAFFKSGWNGTDGNGAGSVNGGGQSSTTSEGNGENEDSTSSLPAITSSSAMAAAAAGNKRNRKKSRRMSSRQLVKQKNPLQKTPPLTTEMVSMKQCDSAKTEPVDSTASLPSLTLTTKLSPLNKNKVRLNNSNSDDKSTSERNKSQPPPPPEHRAKPADDVWYIIDDDPLKPYYQHSLTGEVLWSMEKIRNEKGKITVIPYLNDDDKDDNDDGIKEEIIKKEKKTSSSETTTTTTTTTTTIPNLLFVKSPPPPPPPLGSTRRYSFTGTTHVLVEDKARNSRSVFSKKNRRSSMKVAFRNKRDGKKNPRRSSTGSTSHKSNGGGNMKPANDLWYAITDNPEKPYYQHSITDEVLWSLADKRKEGAIRVIPFPE